MSSLTQFAGSVPENYDKYLGPYLFEPYAIDIAERLKGNDISKVLELACGTGRVTRHIVNLLPKDGKLVATDLNADMIAVAKTKLRDHRLEWLVADAHELPFNEAEFKHVVCQFGVMFFQDKQKAFREAYRVLAPGGIFIFNTWGSLETNPRSAVIVDVMTDLFKEEAPDFMQKGPYSFYNEAEIKQLLVEAGFKDVQITAVKKTVSNWSIDDYLKGFLHGSPLSAFLAQKDETVKEQLKQKLKEALSHKFGNNNTDLSAYVVSSAK